MTANFVIKCCTGKTVEELFGNGELDWYETYADGSDAGKGVLVANWNHFPRLNAGNWPRTPESESAQNYNWGPKGRRFQAILEEMDYHLEWSDTTNQCEDCGGCITADYHTATYAFVSGCVILCADCIRKNPAEYLERAAEHLTDDSLIGIHGVDPAKHGFVLVGHCYPGEWIKTGQEYYSKGYSGVVFTQPMYSECNVYARKLPNMAALQQHVEYGASL